MGLNSANGVNIPGRKSNKFPKGCSSELPLVTDRPCDIHEISMFVAMFEMILTSEAEGVLLERSELLPAGSH